MSRLAAFGAPGRVNSGVESLSSTDRECPVTDPATAISSNSGSSTACASSLHEPRLGRSPPLAPAPTHKIGFGTDQRPLEKAIDQTCSRIA